MGLWSLALIDGITRLEKNTREHSANVTQTRLSMLRITVMSKQGTIFRDGKHKSGEQGLSRVYHLTPYVRKDQKNTGFVVSILVATKNLIGLLGNRNNVYWRNNAAVSSQRKFIE